MEPRSGPLPGPRSTTQIEATEQLLDVFKSAALSVTKLFKTAASAQSRARADGYQDCLDDLVGFLNRENIGLSGEEGWKIRRWAAERLDGREPIPQPIDSDDDNEKADRASSPEMAKPTTARSATPSRQDTPRRTDHSVPISAPTAESTSAPSVDTFAFQTSHPYPNIANLDLSDTRSHDMVPTTTPSHASHHTLGSRPSRQRHGGSSGRMTAKASGSLGRGSGLKRKLNFAEIFDLGSLARENSSGSAKRNRLT